MKDLKDAPPGALGLPSPKGWMDNEIFVKYMNHFIKYVNPSEEKPVLIVLGGHQSHKTLAVIELARENHFYMITLLPYTSHRLQPLDLTFFGLINFLNVITTEKCRYLDV